ncbi:MAG: D-alanyl-D-alanine carboxypeptidase [Defluviitaleaceae bacterium]|nr:D-alanyl-D-alanine carboxypeptidase [Defluviitaleaceae bacterium]
MDQATGTVLFAQNEHERMYPAGLTKMLTALVVLDYLDPQQVVVVGNEIYNIPRGALMAGHQVGEHITVHNLLRGLMIRNGNDSGAILAVQTAQAQRGRGNIPYVNVMEIFSRMMNAYARELGAYNTNFVNPNGLHHDDHYTTAYDLALISRAFMAHPLLGEIAGEVDFIGNSLYGFEGTLPDGLEIGDVRTIEHSWVDTNELISGGPFHFNYASGIRSGSTPQASDCVAAAAERDGVRLIAVVLDSPDPGRWQDARVLFDYGFSTYSYHPILERGQHIDTVVIANAMLGEYDTLDVLAGEGFEALLSQAQLGRLEREIVFYEDFIYVAEMDEYEDVINQDDEPIYDEIRFRVPIYDGIRFRAPIEMNEALGAVIYTLDGRVLFEGEIRAAFSIEERSLDSDMDFYIALVLGTIFSMRALPFWLGGAGVLLGIAGVYWGFSERRRSRNYWSNSRGR